MLFSLKQAFVGRDEIRAPLKDACVRGRLGNSKMGNKMHAAVLLEVPDTHFSWNLVSG